MSQNFPCPNPACRHVFPAEAVRNATLSCPRCKQTFALRPAAAPPSRPAPMAMLLPDAPNPEVVFEPSTQLVDKKAHSGAARGTLSLNWITIGGIVLGAVVLLLVLVFSLRALVRSIKVEESAYARDSRRHGFTYTFPDNPWTPDARVEKELQASLALKRTHPDGWAVLVVRPHDGSAPTAQLMVEEGVRRLGEYFRELDWERKGDRPLAGVRGPVIDFQGEVNGAPMEGECYMAAHQGCVYWLVTWSPAADRAMAGRDWQGMRDRLSLPRMR